jgi:hypothetical protein
MFCVKNEVLKMNTTRNKINLFAWNETIQKLWSLQEKADRKRKLIKKVKDIKIDKKD